MILVADQRQPDEVADGLRQIDVVISVNDPAAQRTRFVEVVHQGLQVAEVLVLARLLLITAGAAQVVVHLVKRSGGIPAQPRKPSIVAVLHHIRDAEKLRVPLEPDVKGKMTRRPGCGDHLVSERIADFGLVAIVAQKPDVLYPRAAGAVAETMIAVEIEIVTLLGPAGRTLTVEGDQDIVVKFAKVKKRAARAAKRVRSRRLLHEQL